MVRSDQLRMRNFSDVLVTFAAQSLSFGSKRTVQVIMSARDQMTKLLDQLMGQNRDGKSLNYGDVVCLVQ